MGPFVFKAIGAFEDGNKTNFFSNNSKTTQTQYNSVKNIINFVKHID
jgi:hypothetical protein